MKLENYITNIQDYPIKGVLFRDITTLIQDGKAFNYACDKFSEYAKEVKADVIVGPESRGFIFGCPVASNLKIGFVPVRKPNKLPRETASVSYDLEYGSNELHIHLDAIKKGQRVLIVDDLLATGGTIAGTIQLVEQLGGIVVGCAFLIELQELKGIQALQGYEVKSLISYE